MSSLLQYQLLFPRHNRSKVNSPTVPGWNLDMNQVANAGTASSTSRASGSITSPRKKRSMVLSGTSNRGGERSFWDWGTPEPFVYWQGGPDSGQSNMNDGAVYEIHNYQNGAEGDHIMPCKICISSSGFAKSRHECSLDCHPKEGRNTRAYYDRVLPSIISTRWPFTLPICVATLLLSRKMRQQLLNMRLF